MTDLPTTDDDAVLGDGPGAGTEEPAGVAELIALIDRLEPMLGASGLDEIEVGAGSTTLVLRAPVGPPRARPRWSRRRRPRCRRWRRPRRPAPPRASRTGPARRRRAADRDVLPVALAGRRPASRSGRGHRRPGHRAVEAMKLFNEIKSDVTGVVRRIVAEDGALVKTHQALIEVSP
ncbi:MAG: acetyl-CoA carboxylase biotin carboxyl carrier protein subunit [Chloroflexota bacterium]